MKKAVLVTLALGLMLLGACTVPVSDPAPLAAGTSAEQTRKAILRGMRMRGWNVKSEQGNEIIAQNYVRGAHLAVVSIKYDDKSITINYVDSRNLRYSTTSSGTKMIHPRYNSWVRNLRKDIAQELALLMSAG